MSARYQPAPRPAPARAARTRQPKPLLWAALRLFAAAAELRRHGATLRAIRLLPEPAIVIDAPPPGLIGTYAVTYPADRQARPTLGCARARNGVPILWSPTPLAPRSR